MCAHLGCADSSKAKHTEVSVRGDPGHHLHLQALAKDVERRAHHGGEHGHCGYELGGRDTGRKGEREEERRGVKSQCMLLQRQLQQLIVSWLLTWHASQ